MGSLAPKASNVLLGLLGMYVSHRVQRTANATVKESLRKAPLQRIPDEEQQVGGDDSGDGLNERDADADGGGVHEKSALLPARARIGRPDHPGRHPPLPTGEKHRLAPIFDAPFGDSQHHDYPIETSEGESDGFNMYRLLIWISVEMILTLVLLVIGLGANERSHGIRLSTLEQVRIGYLVLCVLLGALALVSLTLRLPVGIRIYMFIAYPCRLFGLVFIPHWFRTLTSPELIGETFGGVLPLDSRKLLPVIVGSVAWRVAVGVLLGAQVLGTCWSMTQWMQAIRAPYIFSQPGKGTFFRLLVFVLATMVGLSEFGGSFGGGDGGGHGGTSLFEIFGEKSPIGWLGFNHLYHVILFVMDWLVVFAEDLLGRTEKSRTKVTGSDDSTDTATTISSSSGSSEDPNYSLDNSEKKRPLSLKDLARVIFGRPKGTITPADNGYDITLTV